MAVKKWMEKGMPEIFFKADSKQGFNNGINASLVMEIMCLILPLNREQLTLSTYAI